MASVFITGSADGLGLLAAKKLIKEGHQVVLHARNESRGREALSKAPGAASVLTADLSSLEETRQLAAAANKIGLFDVVIHNAGVYQVPGKQFGPDGWPVLFTVNSLAPYILTALMFPAKRLVYLSSGDHLSGNPSLEHLPLNPFDSAGRITYADTKLHDLILAFAVARRWPDVKSNAVDPGWVPTKMGGAGAPDDLTKGYQTQVWLSVSDDPEALKTGNYFYHKQPDRYHRAADDISLQDQFINICEKITGIPFKNHSSLNR